MCRCTQRRSCCRRIFDLSFIHLSFQAIQSPHERFHVISTLLQGGIRVAQLRDLVKEL